MSGEKERRFANGSMDNQQDLGIQSDRLHKKINKIFGFHVGADDFLLTRLSTFRFFKYKFLRLLTASMVPYKANLRHVL